MPLSLCLLRQIYTHIFGLTFALALLPYYQFVVLQYHNVPDPQQSQGCPSEPHAMALLPKVTYASISEGCYLLTTGLATVRLEDPTARPLLYQIAPLLDYSVVRSVLR